MRYLILLLALVPPTLAQCDTEAIPSPVQGLELFGAGVALEGDLLLVGAPYAGSSGVAYLYERSGAGWALVEALVDATQTQSSSFGRAVAFGGVSRLFVGDVDDSSAGVDHTGSVVVFEDSGSGWAQTQKLWPSDLPEYAEFGQVLAVDGDWLAVAATGVNNNEGATYFFEHDGAQWVERQIVVPATGAVIQGAVEVELAGDLAVVTVMRESENYGWGMLHVYELQNGVWTHIQKLEAPYLRGPDWIHGQSVTIVDDRIVAGTAQAYGQEEDLVIVWERGANGFEFAQELRPHPGQPAPHFGLHVAAFDAELAVTSDDRLHLFSWVDGAYVRTKDLDLDLDLRQPYGWFYGSLDLTSRRVVIAQPFWSNNLGRVHVLELQSEVSTFCPGSTCPCGNPGPNEGCAHSGGGGAWIEACGSTSVSVDDLTLRVANAPVNQFGILFMGAGEQEATLADGRLCVGPGSAGFFRYLPAGHSGAEGSFSVGPGIAGLSQSFELPGRIAPGQTWVFQGWFRDPGGPCGAGSSVSSAVRVTFVP